MRKITTLAVIGALAIAAPVFAQSANDENIKSDVDTLNKDNAAKQNDQNSLAQDRAAKAADKSSGSYGKQAVDSVKVGADHVALGARNAKKSVDEKVLQHHKQNVSSDNGDSQSNTKE